MIQFLPLIQTAGYLGVFGMIFAETGLLFGFIFPGDTLLFAAGFLASKGIFNIFVLLIGTTVSAIVGDCVGYWIGHKIGPRIFAREDSRFFKKRHVFRAQAYFEKNGGKTVFLAQYIPVIRTFVPVVAGVSNMPYRKFFLFNVLGGTTWCVSLTLIGYFLGNRVDNIDHYLLPIILLIIVVSFIPVIREILKSKKAAEQA